MIGHIQGNHQLNIDEFAARRTDRSEQRPEEETLRLTEDEIDSLIDNLFEEPEGTMDRETFAAALEKDGSPLGVHVPKGTHPMDAVRNYSEVASSETDQENAPPTIAVPV